MHCHCGTNNRAPQWTFTDPCKPEVRPGHNQIVNRFALRESRPDLIDGVLQYKIT